MNLHQTPTTAKLHFKMFQHFLVERKEKRQFEVLEKRRINVANSYWLENTVVEIEVGVEMVASFLHDFANTIYKCGKL